MEAVISRGSWSKIIDAISEYEDKGYSIKSFAYGEGIYRVAMLGGLYEAQSVHHVDSISKAADLIQKKWEKDYYVTNMVSDRYGWVLVFSYISGLSNQTFFTSPDFRDFKDKINYYWSKGFAITSITYGDGRYFGVMTPDIIILPQIIRFYPKGLGASDVDNIFSEGEEYSITGLYPVPSGLVVEYSTIIGGIIRGQSILQSGNWNDIDNYLDEKWPEGYKVETLAFCRSWILVMSKVEEEDEGDSDDIWEDDFPDLLGNDDEEENDDEDGEEEEEGDSDDFWEDILR